MGDTNLDGEVNVVDIILIVQHILEVELLEGQALLNADINNSGDGINVSDIITIINLILNN